MALIKSALELALERTKNLKVDEAAIRANQAKADGKKAAGAFLEAAETVFSGGAAAQAADSVDLAALIRAYPSEHREAFRRAVLDVVLAQIQLPLGPVPEERTQAIGKGLEAVAQTAPLPPENLAAAVAEVADLSGQVASFMTQYIDAMKKVDQAIRTQWAPKLREKERMAQARMGQNVRLDPMSDPEFAAFYKQNVDQARAGYIQALDDAKATLTALCGFA